MTGCAREGVINSETMLKYKGYTGFIQFDDEAKTLHGEVLGLRDVITFRGTTPEEIKKEFKRSINGYLEWCRELDQAPEKPVIRHVRLFFRSSPGPRLGPRPNARFRASLNSLAKLGISVRARARTRTEKKSHMALLS